MTHSKTLLSGLLALVLGFAAAPAVLAQDTGSADFSRFVAVGDSLGSGFSSGGLVQGVQVNSIPALIYRQATGQELQQPLASAPGIPALLRLSSLTPLTISAPNAVGSPLNLNFPAPYGNMSVPGFRIGDSIRTRTGNAIVDLVLRGLGSQLEQAVVQQPTFAVLWLGNNDVLGAATSGVVIDNVTLTPANAFNLDYRTVAGALTGAGANLVVVTIPDVTTIPFVSTLPPVVVNPATSLPVLDPNGNPIPLIGPNGPLGAGDRVLLTAQGELGQGRGIPAALGGSGLPLTTMAVLDANEIGAIRTRTAEYNNTIRAVAQEQGAALVDLEAIFADIAVHGTEYGGISFSTSFITGGLFSFDGVHATSFGYAVLANYFIDAINQTYGAAIPSVDVFPFIFGVDPSAVPSSVKKGEAFVFGADAYDRLRRTLRVPSRRTLLRILGSIDDGGAGAGGGSTAPEVGGGAAPVPAKGRPIVN